MSAGADAVGEPSARRITRGEGRSGHPFLPPTHPQRGSAAAAATGWRCLADVAPSRRPVDASQPPALPSVHPGPSSSPRIAHSSISSDHLRPSLTLQFSFSAWSHKEQKSSLQAAISEHAAPGRSSCVSRGLTPSSCALSFVADFSLLSLLYCCALLPVRTSPTTPPPRLFQRRCPPLRSNPWSTEEAATALLHPAIDATAAAPPATSSSTVPSHASPPTPPPPPPIPSSLPHRPPTTPRPPHLPPPSRPTSSARYATTCTTTPSSRPAATRRTATSASAKRCCGRVGVGCARRVGREGWGWRG